MASIICIHYYTNMGDSVSSFMKDVTNVVLTPFREVQKMFTSAISDQAAAGIDAIANAGDELGIDTLANNITSGIGAIGQTGLNLVDRGSDSLFGSLDILKYVPMALIGVGGIFLLKFGGELISEGGKTFRSR